MFNLAGQMFAARAQMQQADLMRMATAEAHLNAFRENNPGKPLDEKTRELVAELSRPIFTRPAPAPAASGYSWTTIAAAFLLGSAIS